MKRIAIACALVVGAVEACSGDLPRADTKPVSGLPPDASAPPQVVVLDAAVDPNGVEAQFVQGQTRISAPPCSRVFIAVAEGKVTGAKDVLEKGDVMIVQYPDEMYVDVDGLALRVTQRFACQLLDKPGPEVSIRRAAGGRDLSWAKGEMHAHLDVGKDVSPDLYLGRLEGTAGVAEHRHDKSVEILAAVDAKGTFIMNGAERRIGPRTIVTVPRDTPHSWKPDPGSKLVAIQMYVPPGPEMRFIQLDADDKDAGAPTYARNPDGGFKDCDPPYTIAPGGRHQYKTQCLINGSQRPKDVPVEAWDPFSRSDTRFGRDGGAKDPRPPGVTSRPPNCPIEDWDMFTHECHRKR